MGGRRILTFVHIVENDIERMRKGIKYVSLFGWMLAMCLLVACRQSSAPAIGDVYAEFQRVPDSTRTKVWWFHGETATTREGIIDGGNEGERFGIGEVQHCRAFTIVLAADRTFILKSGRTRTIASA